MHDQSNSRLHSGTDNITKEALLRFNSRNVPPATLDMTSPNALANWAISEANFRDNQNMNQRSMTRSTSHGLIIPQGEQYRSWSGAATSSVSSQGDSTARFSGSPEPQQPQMRLNPPPSSGNSTLDRYCGQNSCWLYSLPTDYLAIIIHLSATLLPAAISSVVLPDRERCTSNALT